MSYRKPEQIETTTDNDEKPWGLRHTSCCRGFLKKCIHRAERQRKRADVDCGGMYGKYHGYEY